MKLRSFIAKIVRAAILDTKLYKEVEADTTASWQAFLIVILASLTTGIGIGIAGFFSMAGVWSMLGLLIGLIGSIIAWLALSFFAYLIGVKVFRGQGTSATMGGLLRTIGFAISPGVFGIFVFIPVVGGYIWFGVFIWVLIASFVAVRQALNFPTGRAFITCLVSYFACILIVFLAVIPLSASLFSGSCALNSGFNNDLNTIVKSYRFNIIAWESSAIIHELSFWRHSKGENIDNTVGIVTDYFSATEEQKKSLEDMVERILENQIEGILIEEGIFGFPAVNLELGTLPRLLVISPRDKIESMGEIILDAGLSLQEIEDIEARTNELGVSSLIVRLGGIGGLYPSLVTNSASLRFTIDTAVEEWIHQYLTFHPLGFRYVLDLLGIARNYEIATMNETVAGMVSKEIGAIIYDRYYSEQKEPGEATSDFDLMMRGIRMEVDDYLARGEVEVAEEYMEQQRQSLVAKGYNIRKLNQAYFAWHGTYADEPSSVSVIGLELRHLRSHYGSVKEFLDTVTLMTSRQDLKDEVGLRQ